MNHLHVLSPSTVGRINRNALSSSNVRLYSCCIIRSRIVVHCFTVCNGPKKCVFVRKVDTCAGCAPGSKHVDLTKGAFSQLADPDEGVLNVQMRHATDPDEWYEDLWGPKH